ncbi:MAG: hypothetical protein KN64_08830 [Sulfurovum sp. AS07-7]|nr:MAG: hypothetical protein KN64_08830 [Sulfurovum sp. AS07-7]
MRDTRVFRPIPQNEEISISPRRLLVSKTDSKGRILYSNEYFREICGYEESELYGMPHSIVRHPDMPRVLFYLLWVNLKNNKDITAVVKNLAKDGRYYWVMTSFEFGINNETGEKTYISFRKAVPSGMIEQVEPIYAQLVKIEKERGMEASLAYFQAYLHKLDMTYEQWIDSIRPKSIIYKLFNILTPKVA